MLQTPLLMDTWVTATWEEYLENLEDPTCEKAKGYYYDGQMRLEMSPVGPDHANDNGILVVLINLFGIVKGLPLIGLINCSYRKPGKQECQPDLSYYIGERAQSAPKGNTIANLNTTQPPDLAIEIAATSLVDDLGKKRLLYEDLNIAEYWVVDVERASITAFTILPNQGSQRIRQSKVLAGLAIDLLEEALQRSRQQDNTQIGTWFMAELQNN
jgi:Uma2 family endonuclease